MTIRWNRVALTIFKVLSIGIIAALLLKTVDFSEAVNVLRLIDPLVVLPVLCLFGLGQVLSCFRWQLALSQVVKTPPPLLKLLRLYLIGMFVNLGLPTTAGGDVARAEYLRHFVGTRANAYASIFADRLIGIIAVFLVAAAAVIFVTGEVEKEARPLLLSALMALSLVLATAFLVLRAKSFPARLPKLAPFSCALQILARRPAILGACLALAVVVQTVAVILPISLLAMAMMIDVPFSVHFFLVPIVVLATVIPVAPNGLGVRESAFVLLYGQFGVSADAAFALGFAWTLVLTVFGLAGGAVLMWTSGPSTVAPSTSAKRPHDDSG